MKLLIYSKIPSRNPATLVRGSEAAFWPWKYLQEPAYLPEKSYRKPPIDTGENLLMTDSGWDLVEWLKVHKIENFFGSDFGICVISLLVMSKY